MPRVERVQEELKREISRIIHDEVKDPRLGFVTVTKVELTRDLRFAKVYFSVLGQEQDYKRTKEGLMSSMGFIRKLVGERVSLRFTPEIMFKEDKSCEYSIRIEEVLNQIKEENGPKKSSRRNKKQ